MAVVPKPVDSLHAARGLVLNKRFIRIVIGAASFSLVVFLVLRHRLTRRHVILPIPGWNETRGVYSYTTHSDYYPISLNPVNKSTEELCATFPKHLLNLVQPVLKMGYSEDRAKVEAQLASVSACFGSDQLLVFSDRDEKIGKYNAIDILASLPEKYYDQSYNPHIEDYLRQREMQDNGILDTQTAKRIDGWKIDKFKFLPMIERAWLLQPEKPFYFFYETDTYVFWDNLFRFLQTFDPDKPIYMGSPSAGRRDKHVDIKTWFANGGPGFILSRGAIKALRRETSPNGQWNEPTLTEKWLPLLTHDCCGDSVVGFALWRAGIAVQGYYPMFNPHSLHGIPYSDRFWCQPVLTLHKTSPRDMKDVWRWEFGQRKERRPLLYSDLWNFHHPGESSDVLENWDNGDRDSWIIPLEEDVDSFDKCEAQCQLNSSCLQWNWRGRDEKKCVLMRSIQYGKARKPEILGEGGKKPEEDEKPEEDDKDVKWVDYKAGWIKERVEKWRKKKQCNTVEWMGPSITRVYEP